MQELPPELRRFMVQPHAKAEAVPRRELANSRRTKSRVNGNATTPMTVGLLEQLGWQVQRVRDDIVYVTRPGKDTSEGHSGTVGAVAPGVFKSFTDTDPHFDGERTYDYIDVYARLHHDGDVAAAEKALQPTYGGVTPSDVMDKWKDRAVEERTDASLERLREVSYTATQLAELPDLEWVVDEWVVENGFTVMYGAPKAGKTFSMIDMAACVAAGIDWQGQEVRQQKVAYLVGEGMQGYKRRLHAWQAWNDGVELGDDLTFINATGWDVRDPDTQQDLAYWAQVMEWGVIVLDTLAILTPGMEENSVEGMGEFINVAAALRNVGLTVIVVHHTGKDPTQGLRGSSSLPGAVDAGILVTRPHGLERPDLKITLEFAREAEPGAFMHRELYTPDGCEAPVVRDGGGARPVEKTGQKQILRALVDNGPMHRSEVAELCMMQPGSATDLLQHLLDAGLAVISLEGDAGKRKGFVRATPLGESTL